MVNGVAKDEVAEMAAFIARALYEKSIVGLEDEPAWNAAGDDLQAQFLVLAHVAMGAHDAWLVTHGFSVVKVNRKARRAEVKRLGLVDSSGREITGKA